MECQQNVSGQAGARVGLLCSRIKKAPKKALFCLNAHCCVTRVTHPHLPRDKDHSLP